MASRQTVKTEENVHFPNNSYSKISCETFPDVGRISCRNQQMKNPLLSNLQDLDKWLDLRSLQLYGKKK
jgi:hypothetical protein